MRIMFFPLEAVISGKYKLKTWVVELVFYEQEYSAAGEVAMASTVPCGCCNGNSRKCLVKEIETKFRLTWIL